MYATVDDLARTIPGGIPGDDIDRAEWCLDEASLLVEEAAGRAYDDPATAPRAWRFVTVSAARRLFQNPDAISMEQIGGTYSYQRAQSQVTGAELTGSERRRIRRSVGRYSAGSVRLANGLDDTSLGAVTPTDTE